MRCELCTARTEALRWKGYLGSVLLGSTLLGGVLLALVLTLVLPRMASAHPLGCRMMGGNFAQTDTGASSCLFIAPANR